MNFGYLLPKPWEDQELQVPSLEILSTVCGNPFILCDFLSIMEVSVLKTKISFLKALKWPMFDTYLTQREELVQLKRVIEAY